MATIELETYLPAHPELVWDHVLQSRLLCFVAKGMLVFEPVDPNEFPERWSHGPYLAKKYLWGFVSIGWQIIKIEFPRDRGHLHQLRDNGRAWLIQTWDHTIEVEPYESGTRYVDRVTINAGILTPFIAVFARKYYRHRQKRWHMLVAANFDYSAR